MLWTGIAATLALAAAGCGSDPQTGPTGQLALAMAPSKSGDDQTQTAGQLLGSPLRVLVTRDEVPAAGATVRWTTQDGGSLGDPTTVADDNGIASNDWTLGDGVGAQTAEASIEGAEGSPITFTAHAILGGGGGGGGGETAIVAVSGPPINKFSPGTITIKVGETVTWRWAPGPSATTSRRTTGPFRRAKRACSAPRMTTATPSPRQGPTPTTARRTARRCPAPWWSSRRPDR